MIDTELSGPLAKPEAIGLLSDRKGWGKQQGCLPAQPLQLTELSGRRHGRAVTVCPGLLAIPGNLLIGLFGVS